jgi:hypothetical protein
VSAGGLAEIADRTLFEAGGWSVVLVGEEEITPTARELEQELRFLLEDEGHAGGTRVFAASEPGPSLVADLTRLAPGDVALLPLPQDILAPVARELDYARDRLRDGPAGVIITTDTGVRILAAEAPSFWSWVGPRIWTVDRTAGQLDPEARLASLRQGTGWTDAAVIERAEERTLPPDPVFAEWLVLLGRGDLLVH